MVIPTVIQVGASSTADITNNCPEWGIYVEGLRGILLPLTRFARVAMRMLCLHKHSRSTATTRKLHAIFCVCKTHGVLHIWQILSIQVLETGQPKGNFQ